MSQITLTLDMTPENVSVLCEVLPRLTLKSSVLAFVENEVADATNPKVPAASKGKPVGENAKEPPAENDDRKPEPPTSVAESEKTSPSDAPNKTDVRAVALKLSKAGKQDVLKAIFAKYGADKLSGVAEERYPELMKDLEAANGEA